MNIFLTFVISFFFGLLATLLFEIVLKTNKTLRHRYYFHHNVFLGFHVHHSTYGLACFAASLILLALSKNISALVLLGFGLGIICMHTISDGRLIFFEKEATKK